MGGNSLVGTVTKCLFVYILFLYALAVENIATQSFKMLLKCCDLPSYWLAYLPFTYDFVGFWQNIWIWMRHTSKYKTLTLDKVKKKNIDYKTST